MDADRLAGDSGTAGMISSGCGRQLSSLTVAPEELHRTGQGVPRSWALDLPFRKVSLDQCHQIL